MGSYYPTADQRLLRDEVRRVLFAEHPFEPRRGRAIQDDIWAEAAELGWPAALLPERAGGIGGLAEAALLAEEVGRAMRPEPLALIAAAAQLEPASSARPAAAVPASCGWAVLGPSRPGTAMKRSWSLQEPPSPAAR